MAEERKERNGYVKLYRKIEDWQHFKDPYVLQVFIFCLLHAEKDLTGGKKNVDEGSFTTTITEMSNILGKGRPKIYECLKILNLDRTIKYKKDGKNTIITVLKYSNYQDGFIKNFFEKLG